MREKCTIQASIFEPDYPAGCPRYNNKYLHFTDFTSVLINNRNGLPGLASRSKPHLAGGQCLKITTPPDMLIQGNADVLLINVRMTDYQLIPYTNNHLVKVLSLPLPRNVF